MYGWLTSQAKLSDRSQHFKLNSNRKRERIQRSRQHIFLALTTESQHFQGEKMAKLSKMTERK